MINYGIMSCMWVLKKVICLSGLSVAKFRSIKDFSIEEYRNYLILRNYGEMDEFNRGSKRSKKRH